MAISLAISFLALWLSSFAVAIFFMRTAREANTLQKRIVSVLSSKQITDVSSARIPVKYFEPMQKTYFSWVENFIAPAAGRWLRTLLTQAQTPWGIGNTVVAIALLAISTFTLFYFLTKMLALSTAIAILAMCSPFGLLLFRRSRRLTRFEEALPDCIEMCARSLRAGHSMSIAIGILAEQSSEPARTEFREVFKKQSHGLPIRDALHQMLQRVPSRDLRVLIAGILVQKDTGGNLAEIMDRVAFVIRERVRIRRDIKTHTVQGRLTGWILFFLPIVLLLLINVLSPGYSNILFSDPIGKKMLYAGLVLLISGGVIIRQIVNGIEL